MNTKVFKKALVCLTLVIPFANSSSYCASQQQSNSDGNFNSIPSTFSNLNNFKNDSDDSKQDGNEELKNIINESDVQKQKSTLLQIINKYKNNSAVFDEEVRAAFAQVQQILPKSKQQQTSSSASTWEESLVPCNNQPFNIIDYPKKEGSQLQVEYIDDLQILALEKSKLENKVIDNAFFSIPGKSKNNVNMIIPVDDIYSYNNYNSTPEEQQEVRNYFERSSRLLRLVDCMSSAQTQDNKNYRSDRFNSVRKDYIEKFQQEVNNSQCKEECKQLIINASKFMNSDVRFRIAMDELFNKLYDMIFGIVYSDAAYVSQKEQPEPYYRVVDESKRYYNQGLDNKLVKMINGYETFDDLIKGIIELQNVKSDNKSDNKADIQNVEADNVLADFKKAMNSSNAYGSAFQYLAKLYDEALQSYFNYVNGVQSFYTLLSFYFNKKDDNFIKEADAKRKEMLNLSSSIKNKYNNIKTLVLAFTVLKECNEKIDINTNINK